MSTFYERKAQRIQKKIDELEIQRKMRMKEMIHIMNRVDFLKDEFDFLETEQGVIKGILDDVINHHKDVSKPPKDLAKVLKSNPKFKIFK